MWRLRRNSAGAKDDVGCCWESERRALRDVDLGAAISLVVDRCRCMYVYELNWLMRLDVDDITSHKQAVLIDKDVVEKDQI